MLRWFLHKRLDAEEKDLGASMDYLRFIADTSSSAFLRFAAIMPFANSRKVLPARARYVAQLVAVQCEDCGPCLQITVNLARKEGVGTDLIRSVLAGDSDHLPDDLAEVYAFGSAMAGPPSSPAHPDEGSSDVAGGSTSTDPIHVDPATLRETMRSRYGDEGLVELAYAIASSRIPPTVKRVLGYAESCEMVSVRAD